MTEMPTNLSFVQDLPSFEGLLLNHSTSLIRPFSLFSLFRSSTPSLPQPNVLAPMHTLATFRPEDLEAKRVIKALIAFQNYAQQLKSYSSSRKEGKINASESAAVEILYEAYPLAFQLASALWKKDGVNDQDSTDLVSLQRECLEGLFQLHNVFADHFTGSGSEAAQSKIDRILLGSIFAAAPPRGDIEEYLTPLFTQSAEILSSLLQTSRSIANSKVKRNAPVTSSIIVCDEDSLQLISLLQTYARGMESIERLEGPNLAKTKAQKEEDKRRPMRLAMEARMLKCDVALSMANRDIKSIKSRALKKLPEAKRELSEREGEEDTQLRSSPAEEVVEGDMVQWETLAECELVACLKRVKVLLEAHKGGVISDHVDREDYLGPDPRSISLPPSPKQDNSPSNQNQNLDPASDESQEESLSESSDSEGPDNSHACPLRSLFRLHDRYEEQRLAVWLSLPTDRRGGMGTYMRGEDGKVGDAWDAAGMVMLLDYDSHTLLSFGLGGDKLDKWIELASKRNAKKIRRRGRKTV